MAHSSPPVLDPLRSERAAHLVGLFPGVSILVVGDLMVDQFVVGRVDRISPEAPVPVVEFEREERRIGGAGNVAHNVRALGGHAELVGVTGSDEEADRLVSQLKEAGIGSRGVVAHPSRRTTVKMRIVTSRNQQVARVDYETDADIAGDLERAVAAQATQLAGSSAAIVVSDYLKGAITAGVMHSLVDVTRIRGIPMLIDPKIPHLGLYRGGTVITPNHHEAEIATHVRIKTADDARRAALMLRELSGCDRVLITRGEHGMYLLDGDADGTLPAVAREVSDVTGAGDTVIATLALAFGVGASTAEAAALANHAAGVVVGKFGPATVSPTELVATFA
jgi:rfaE bifunctional protein kinase chain/domain